tara:strand:+ start:120 stop:581 length:462 start_codon:yes stop_codon:yes gene_type:complete
MANGNMQGSGMMVAPNPQTNEMPMQEKINTPIVDGNQFREAVANLSAESSVVLEQHLTPGVKKAMAELFGPEVVGVLKDIGPTEPTINIPVSVVSQAYPAKTIEESIQMMGQDFASKGQQNIPSTPQGGLGGDPMMDSPQTNVPPGPMPTGMV